MENVGDGDKDIESAFQVFHREKIIPLFKEFREKIYDSGRLLVKRYLPNASERSRKQSTYLHVLAMDENEYSFTFQGYFIRFKPLSKDHKSHMPFDICVREADLNAVKSEIIINNPTQTISVSFHDHVHLQRFVSSFYLSKFEWTCLCKWYTKFILLRNPLNYSTLKQTLLKVSSSSTNKHSLHGWMHVRFTPHSCFNWTLVYAKLSYDINQAADDTGRLTCQFFEFQIFLESNEKTKIAFVKEIESVLFQFPDPETMTKRCTIFRIDGTIVHSNGNQLISQEISNELQVMVNCQTDLITWIWHLMAISRNTKFTPIPNPLTYKTLFPKPTDMLPEQVNGIPLNESDKGLEPTPGLLYLSQTDTVNISSMDKSIIMNELRDKLANRVDDDDDDEKPLGEIKGLCNQTLQSSSDDSEMCSSSDMDNSFFNHSSTLDSCAQKATSDEDNSDLEPKPRLKYIAIEDKPCSFIPINYTSPEPIDSISSSRQPTPVKNQARKNVTLKSIHLDSSSEQSTSTDPPSRQNTPIENSSRLDLHSISPPQRAKWSKPNRLNEISTASSQDDNSDNESDNETDDKSNNESDDESDNETDDETDDKTNNETDDETDDENDNETDDETENRPLQETLSRDNKVSSHIDTSAALQQQFYYYYYMQQQQQQQMYFHHLNQYAFSNSSSYMKKETVEIQESKSDSFQKFQSLKKWIDKCLKPKPYNNVPLATIHKAYLKWCKKSGARPGSRADLNDLRKILEMDGYHVKPNAEKRGNLECLGISLV